MAQTRAYSSDALLMKRQLLYTLPPTIAVRVFVYKLRCTALLLQQ
jgi:hypothetical protein